MPPENHGLTTGDVLQIIAQVVTLIAAVIGAVVSARTAFKVLKLQQSDTKRHFCLELKREFDSAEMFKCRYESWKKLDQGVYDKHKTVSQLLNSTDWEYQVSYVIHFFESLEYYCEQNMIDTPYAKKLFARPFKMWHDKLITKLTIDEASKPYENWHKSLINLGTRFDK